MQPAELWLSKECIVVKMVLLLSEIEVQLHMGH